MKGRIQFLLIEEIYLIKKFNLRGISTKSCKQIFYTETLKTNVIFFFLANGTKTAVQGMELSTSPKYSENEHFIIIISITCYY